MVADVSEVTTSFIIIAELFVISLIRPIGQCLLIRHFFGVL